MYGRRDIYKKGNDSDGDINKIKLINKTKIHSCKKHKAFIPGLEEDIIKDDIFNSKQSMNTKELKEDIKQCQVNVETNKKEPTQLEDEITNVKKVLNNDVIPNYDNIKDNNINLTKITYHIQHMNVNLDELMKEREEIIKHQ